MTALLPTLASGVLLSSAAVDPVSGALPSDHESFDGLRAGEFTKLATELGVMHVTGGTAEIDDQHAVSGQNCLHLLGDETEVVLRTERTDVYQLAFRAERWTRRDPFSFEIEARSGGRWRPVFDGSSEVLVGRPFLSHVRVPIDREIDGLRFRCTAPKGTGVLIDDLTLEPRQPMRLAHVGAAQPVLPVLLGNHTNPILRIDLLVEGNQPAPSPGRGRTPALTLERLVLDLEGTSRLADWAAVEVFRGPEELGSRDPDAAFSERFGDAQEASEGRLAFEGELALEPGANHLWVSVTPRADADIDGFVDAGLLDVRLVDGEPLLTEPLRPETRQRMGVSLRNAGDDGVPVYRIPGLVTTNEGTLLAVYDVRRRGWGDLPGDIDVGLSRSRDRGATWEPMRVILDYGADAAFAYDGVGDPAILVDRGTGTVWVIASWHHGALGWNGSGPGFEPSETGQLVLTRSDDDGVTWSKPINITRQVKLEEWAFLLQGPGRGITMRDGRIVFPAQYQLSPARGREPRATVIWSEDHGTTWQIGAEARSNTTEAAVVELRDGELMLNMRDNRGRGRDGARAVATSRDMGASWRLHSTSSRALPEPVCMASLIHVGRELDGEADGRLLFSNPAVPRPPRRSITIQGSTDHGESWPVGCRVLLDEGSAAGYSCLTMVDEQTVGIVYECSRAHLAFQRVPLAELFASER